MVRAGKGILSVVKERMIVERRGRRRIGEGAVWRRRVHRRRRVIRHRRRSERRGSGGGIRARVCGRFEELVDVEWGGVVRVPRRRGHRRRRRRGELGFREKGRGGGTMNRG